MIRAQRHVVALHRSYLQQIVQAHEEERARVARDVHDDAVQRLVHLGRELDLHRQCLTPDRGNELHRLSGIKGELEDLADALRLLAHNLHPAALEHAGLLPALTQLCDETARHDGVNVELRLPPEQPELDDDVKLTLFRIAQEAIHNIVKHSGARSAMLTVLCQPDRVTLLAEDAGIGFDAMLPRRGIGLVSIEERARLVGGNATIQSAPGRGTRVAVAVPLKTAG